MTHSAHQFARDAHEAAGQKRRYSGLPYIIHPENVAAILSAVTDDQEIIMAALLHDTVEDTETTLSDIKLHFGERVSQLVYEVTTVSTLKDGNRATRKSIDHTHFSKASPDGQSIKIADMMDNMPLIIQNDPGFAKTYMAEKRQLLPLLKQGNSLLYHHAKIIINNYYT